MGATPSSDKVSWLTIGEKFETDKFLGVWYDIAHIPNPYESGCEHSMITYTRTATDKIRITLKCMNYGESASTHVGEVRYNNPNDPSKMEVRFDSIFSGWSNFWIYDTDYTSYAIAGNDSGYVWIMSREPSMTFCRLWALRNRAKNMGFEIERIKADINLIRLCED